MSEATYFHAGCPVCVAAEDTLIDALGAGGLEIDRVHLGEQPTELAAARAAGVQSVPALVVGGSVFHINHGASLEDLAG